MEDDKELIVDGIKLAPGVRIFLDPAKLWPISEWDAKERVKAEKSNGIYTASIVEDD